MKSFMALFLGIALLFVSTIHGHAYIDPQRGIVQYWESKPQPKYVPPNNYGPAPLPSYRHSIPGINDHIHIHPKNNGGFEWYEQGDLLPEKHSMDPDGHGGFYVR